VLSATCEAGQPVDDTALGLAPEADYVVLACSSAGPGETAAKLRDQLLEAGAGEVFAIMAQERAAERSAA
jgi:hypothetical protein